jgi:hypothetical protein
MDYAQMKDSMIFGQLLDFSELIRRLTELQEQINKIQI